MPSVPVNTKVEAPKPSLTPEQLKAKQQELREKARKKKEAWKKKSKKDREKKIENGAMPVLKKLTMSKCNNLTLLPVGIEGLAKLEELCVHDMHTAFMALRRDTEVFQAVQHILVIRSSTGIFRSLLGM
ncbi:hypothetical protein ACE6H2_014243 [Prunus campanulata]